LPQRWADRVSPRLVELVIGAASAAAVVALRLPFQEFAGDRAPYALNFLGVVFAAVLGGWRSGLVALVGGQLLTWYFVVPPYMSFDIPDRQRFAALILATVSQALILVVIGLYQREIDKGTAERERRMELMNHALNEIDHRTRNNYQTVLALVQLQTQRANNDEVKAALQQVSDRIQAISAAAERLALRSGDIDRVKLDDHLCELCEQIERGLTRDGIELECNVESVAANPDTATSISIIVNELVTNAIKHAFNGERSGNVRVIGKAGQQFELIVADDGMGIEPTRRKGGSSGLGTKLVDSFVKQLGAKHEVTSNDNGTTHHLFFPKLD